MINEDLITNILDNADSNFYFFDEDGFVKISDSEVCLEDLFNDFSFEKELDLNEDKPLFLACSFIRYDEYYAPLFFIPIIYSNGVIKRNNACNILFNEILSLDFAENNLDFLDFTKHDNPQSFYENLNGIDGCELVDDIFFVDFNFDSLFSYLDLNKNWNALDEKINIIQSGNDFIKYSKNIYKLIFDSVLNNEMVLYITNPSNASNTILFNNLSLKLGYNFDNNFISDLKVAENVLVSKSEFDNLVRQRNNFLSYFNFVSSFKKKHRFHPRYYQVHREECIKKIDDTNFKKYELYDDKFNFLFMEDYAFPAIIEFKKTISLTGFLDFELSNDLKNLLLKLISFKNFLVLNDLYNMELINKSCEDLLLYLNGSEQDYVYVDLESKDNLMALFVHDSREVNRPERLKNLYPNLFNREKSYEDIIDTIEKNRFVEFNKTIIDDKNELEKFIGDIIATIGKVSKDKEFSDFDTEMPITAIFDLMNQIVKAYPYIYWYSLMNANDYLNDYIELVLNYKIDREVMELNFEYNIANNFISNLTNYFPFIENNIKPDLMYWIEFTKINEKYLVNQFLDNAQKTELKCSDEMIGDILSDNVEYFKMNRPIFLMPYASCCLSLNEKFESLFDKIIIDDKLNLTEEHYISLLLRSKDNKIYKKKPEIKIKNTEFNVDDNYVNIDDGKLYGDGEFGPSKADLRHSAPLYDDRYFRE